jgi:hypothetical protein
MGNRRFRHRRIVGPLTGALQATVWLILSAVGLAIAGDGVPGHIGASLTLPSCESRAYGYLGSLYCPVVELDIGQTEVAQGHLVTSQCRSEGCTA